MATVPLRHCHMAVWGRKGDGGRRRGGNVWQGKAGVAAQEPGARSHSATTALSHRGEEEGTGEAVHARHGMT